MALAPNEKNEIYLNHCGCECPAYEDCPHMNDNGTCSLEEPWLDCDDFQCEYADAIEAAENEIANKEAGHASEEEDESEDDW